MKHIFQAGIKGLLGNSYVFSILISIAIIYLLPGQEKYRIREMRSGITDKPESDVIYADLDNDQISESVNLFSNTLGNAAIKIIDQNQGLKGWWDFKGSLVRHCVIEGDYDNNGKGEIYFLSTCNDSLYLNFLEYLGPERYKTGSKFITTINKVDNKIDFAVGAFFLLDARQDNFKEVFVNVNAGYSLQPRRLFVYDRKRDTVIRGPLMGVNTSLIPFSVNEDKYPEYVLSSGSTNNMADSSSLPYTDHSSWLMLLDHELRFKFKPIEFKGHKTSVTCLPFRQKNTVSIIALFEFSNNSDSKPAIIMKYDLLGNCLQKRDIPKHGDGMEYRLIINSGIPGEAVYLSDNSGRISKINANLEIDDPVCIADDGLGNPYHFELDKDGKYENVFLVDDYESMVITRSDLSDPVTCKILFGRETPMLSLIKNGYGTPFLFIQKGERERWLKYEINPFFFMKYIVWAGIFVVVFLFVIFIRWQYSLDLKRRQAVEQELEELQLALLSRHLEPHFTMNALNSLSSLIFKGDKEKAYEVFTKFSQLLRFSVKHSGAYSTSLAEEIEFLRNYLDVQKERFGNIFDYEIHVETNVDKNQEVPKMLLQQYAENSIKHGLLYRRSDGLIVIRITSEDGLLRISVRDNGLGREHASQFNKSSTQTGLNTMQQIFKLYGSLRDKSIRQEINDLYDPEGNPAGTEVIITISAEKNSESKNDSHKTK